MLITKIEVQKKNKSRVNLYIDNEFNCGLSIDNVMQNRLKEGKEISLQTLDYIKNESEKESALNKALKHISKSQKTSYEIKDYLKNKGFELAIIESVILKMKEYNFINDELYAKNFVNYKTKSSGKRKIKMQLKMKGISEKLIDESLENYSKDFENIDIIATKYLKNKEKNLKTKQKAFSFLAGRGYETEDIIRCLNKIFNNMGD